MPRSVGDGKGRSTGSCPKDSTATHCSASTRRWFSYDASKAPRKSPIEGGKPPDFLHLYIGEEATAVGVCAHLRPGDWITSTHRGHGHAWPRVSRRARDGRALRQAGRMLRRPRRQYAPLRPQRRAVRHQRLRRRRNRPRRRRRLQRPRARHRRHRRSPSSATAPSTRRPSTRR